MKKLFLLLLFTVITLNINAYHHAFHHSYHPHVSRPVHVVHRSHNNHTNVTHTTPKARTTSLKKQSVQPIKHKYGPNVSNIMLWYLIARPHHSGDTYNVDGKELKLCPKCHKKLIKLNMKTCNSCK